MGLLDTYKGSQEALKKFQSTPTPVIAPRPVQPSVNKGQPQPSFSNTALAGGGSGNNSNVYQASGSSSPSSGTVPWSQTAEGKAAILAAAGGNGSINNQSASSYANQNSMPLPGAAKLPSQPTSTPAASAWQDNVDLPYDQRLAGYRTNLKAAQDELIRVKGVYETAAPDHQQRIKTWADQVRQAAGIGTDDAVFGNNPNITPEQQAVNITNFRASEQTGQPAVTANQQITPEKKAGGYQGMDLSGITKALMDLAQSRKTAGLQQIATANATAQQGLNAQESAAGQNAVNQRNQTDAASIQSQQRMKEAFANAGLLSSGDNVSAQVGLETARQNSMNDINQSESSLLQDLVQKRSLLNNNAAREELALTSGIEADQMGKMFDLLLRQDDRAFQVDNNNFNRETALAELLGVLNGQSTLQGKKANLDAALQVGDRAGQLVSPKSDWGELFNQPDAPLNFEAEQTAIKNGQWSKEFDLALNKWTSQMGIEWEKLDRDTQQAWAQIAISQQNANTGSANAENNRLMDVWKATNKAPAGITGVPAGTPFYSEDGKPKELTQTQVADLISSSPLVKKEYNSEGRVTGTNVDEKDKQTLALYIKSLPGMTAEKAKPWFVAYGLWSGN